MNYNLSNFDVRNKILRGSYINEQRIEKFKNQNFLLLKRECLTSGKLFEDPLFPPNNKSLFYSKPLPKGVRWLRPSQIVKNAEPKFIVNIAHADDLDQGTLGNCWFVAGCAAIAYMPSLFKKVVPQSQEFNSKEYAGIFHFRFWIYGIWYDVVIDDYLPVDASGRLIFCRNAEEKNEFWPSLLEKAYAKVCGSYQNLEGGFISDALIDMTGGIEETIILNKKHDEKEKNSVWKILYTSRKLNSLNGAYIEPDPHTFEAKLPNGLVKGHAFTITRVALVVIKNKEVKLIRLRNPWNNEFEWKGAWSDHSREWEMVSNEIKEILHFRKLNEGEFWMSFDEFYQNFDSVQFCHLTPDSLSEEILKEHHNENLSWKSVSFHGEWVPGKSSGGSGNNNNQLFWTNPQFLIKLVDVDKSDNEDMATVVISLMQKYTREKRTQKYGQSAEEFMQFRLYRILFKEDVENAIRLGQKFYANQLERIGNSSDYINKRDVTARFRIPPGDYLIIPSLFEPNIEAEFLLRIFTENSIDDNNTHILHENSGTIKQMGESKLFITPNSERVITRLSGTISNEKKPSLNSNEICKCVKMNFNSYNENSSCDSDDNIKKFELIKEKQRNRKEACNLM